MKTITIRLDDELHKKFKLYALENNKSMQEIIEEYIKKSLKKKISKEKDGIPAKVLAVLPRNSIYKYKYSVSSSTLYYK